MSNHLPGWTNRSHILNNPYSPSLASLASSSASSIFSLAPTVSSHATSVSSGQLPESVQKYSDIEHHGLSHGQCSQEAVRSSHAPRTLKAPPSSSEQRSHQRRPPRSAEINRPICTSEARPLPPVPALVRQAERKTNFVDNLVDSAALIVEKIWPTYMNGKSDTCPGAKGVLPLRTFIQETLRRSRTSYSTLQVSLYYLILIRPHIPKGDFSDMSQDNAQQMRALQCGRRMFLAALILASKYLQDRNYSARAWSRISGLQTAEINVNELAFLDAVNWRLHISETIFQKWTDLVVKYTSGSGPNEDARKAEWSKLIMKLTPELTIDEAVGKVQNKEQVTETGIETRIVPATECLLRADLEIPNKVPLAISGVTATPITLPILDANKLSHVSSDQPSHTGPNHSLPLPTMEPEPDEQVFKRLPFGAALSVVPQPETPAVRPGPGNSMIAATAQMNQLQNCTTNVAFLPRNRSMRPGGEKSMLPAPSVLPSITRCSSLSSSMTSSPETLLNDSDASTTSSPFAFSRSSSVSSASSFDSVTSFDATRRGEKRVVTPATRPVQKSSTNAAGLNTPTPSPQRYLVLRPKVSKDHTLGAHAAITNSPLSSCRKRRVCELSLPTLRADLGVSSLSPGITQQIKVQLQMKTPPPTKGLGPKRIRCGDLESSVLNHKVPQEEVS